jgi:glutathione S-transferase
MSSQIKPITLHGQSGPNPPKVAFIMEELNLPYEYAKTGFDDVKSPEYLAINPNGRLPAIQDPNTGITLWESGAIIEYLIEQYDTERSLTFPRGSPEYWHAKQWLYFQVSGQGPYAGQFAWFTKYHPEKVPSAQDRYAKEIQRFTTVLDGHLAKQKVNGEGDGPWLVGNKISFADISFLSWQMIVQVFMTKEQYDANDWPHVKLWTENMLKRKGLRKIMDKVLGEHKQYQDAIANIK